MEDFKIRIYTKKELALMYFPDSMPRTAVNHLMVWLKKCTPLWHELQSMGYEKTRWFNRLTKNMNQPLSTSSGGVTAESDKPVLPDR